MGQTTGPGLSDNIAKPGACKVRRFLPAGRPQKAWRTPTATPLCKPPAAGAPAQRRGGHRPGPMPPDCRPANSWWRPSCPSPWCPWCAKATPWPAPPACASWPGALDVHRRLIRLGLRQKRCSTARPGRPAHRRTGQLHPGPAVHRGQRQVRGPAAPADRRPPHRRPVPGHHRARRRPPGPDIVRADPHGRAPDARGAAFHGASAPGGAPVGGGHEGR